MIAAALADPTPASPAAAKSLRCRTRGMDRPPGTVPAWAAPSGQPATAGRMPETTSRDRRPDP